MTTLEVIAPRLGGLGWVSAELFTLEGRWAERMREPTAVTHLATHSRYYGWHTTLWRDALPDSPALQAAGHIRPPTPGWEAAFAAVAGDAMTTDTHRLSALYRVLVPRLVADVVGLATMLGGPGDGAIERIIGLVRPDLAADLHGGIALLTATLGDDDMVEIASSTTKTLDQAFRT